MVSLSNPSTYLQKHDIIPQPSALLTRLESSKSIREIRQLHALILKTDSNNSAQLICTKLVSLLHSSQGSSNHRYRSSLTYACSLVKQWCYPEISLLNALIQHTSSLHRNCLPVTLDLYRHMLIKGILPDRYTVPYVLKACSQSQALREGQQVHGFCVKTGLVCNVYVRNTLMRLYGVCGVMGNVCKVFDENLERDLISWTTLIQAYVRMGYPKDAVATFFRMCEANTSPDRMTLVVVLSACAKLGDLSLGREIHSYMDHHGISADSDVFLGNALVDMYLKCGQAELARKVFDGMPVKNVVSWNSMIAGLAQQGEFKEALKVFRKMQSTGLKPDDFTLVAVLNSCANLGVFELGKWVHAYVDKNNIKADGFIGNALVDMYAKCGSIDLALRVFNSMECRDVYSYTAMVVGLAMHGEAERALDIFSEMHTVGIQPDEVTFVGVLAACSHAGLVEEGWKYFKDMSRVYNLQPQTEHYGCMVDLLGRAGLVNQALEFIKDMPILPDASVWGALLGACKIHAKVELGESVVEELIKMEPERDGAYILMSNIYSSANRWRDALKWRKVMKERRMKKVPGCSSIEVDGVVHEFRKGEKSHPKIKELCWLLDKMVDHLRDNVYL